MTIPEGATHRWENQLYKLHKNGVLFVWWVDHWRNSNNTFEDMEAKNFDNHFKPKKKKLFLELENANV